MAYRPVLSPPDIPSVTLRREHTDADLFADLAAGRLERIRRGAFIATPPPAEEPWDRRRRYALAKCAAVVRIASARSVLSHESAALIHGCWLWRIPEQVYVTQSSSPSGRRSADVVRVRRDVPPEDITMIHGLPVTSLRRTVIDCVRRMHPRDGLVVADSALRILTRPDPWLREQTEERRDRVRRELLRAVEAEKDRRGRIRALAVLQHADGFSESPPESVLRWIALSRGLPAPVAQMRVETDRGTYFPDLTWRFRRVDADDAAALLVVHAEFDGRIKYGAENHGSAQPLMAEKIREDAIRELGHRVVRFVGDDLKTPDAVARRIARFLPASLTRRPRSVPGLRGTSE